VIATCTRDLPEWVFEDFVLEVFELAIRELLLLGTRLLIRKLSLKILIGGTSNADRPADG
jgi:hypothetical protein